MYKKFDNWHCAQEYIQSRSKQIESDIKMSSPDNYENLLKTANYPKIISYPYSTDRSNNLPYVVFESDLVPRRP